MTIATENLNTELNAGVPDALSVSLSLSALEDYVNAGIVGVTADNLAAVNAEVDKAFGAQANTVAKVQAFVVAANEALAQVAMVIDTSGAQAQVEDAVQSLGSGSAEAIALGISASPLRVFFSATAAPAVDAAAALLIITNYANNSTTNPKPTLQNYVDAGIVDVTLNNIVAVNAQVDKSFGTQANTVAKVQAFVVAANNALAKIEAYNNGDGTTPPALAVADYEAAGVTGVTSKNLDAVNAKVLAADTGGADTPAEVQAFVTQADAALAKIEAYNNGDGISPSALAVADYEAVGVIGVTADNLVAVNASVLGAIKGGADSAPEVQALVDAGIENQLAALAKIAAYADNSANPKPILQDYATAGITGVTADNLAAVNARVDAVGQAAADSVPEVQALVNQGADAQLAALSVIAAYGDNPANPKPTVSDYAAAGVAGVTANTIDLLNSAIDKKANADSNQASEVQALADIANKVLLQAADNVQAISQADLENLGITDLTARRGALQPWR